jgi:magnesium transporter
MSHELEAIEDLVTIFGKSNFQDMLQRMSQVRKRHMFMNRLIGSQPDVIRMIAHRMNKNQDMAMYMEDIYDTVFSMKADMIQFENVLARAQSLYMARINIEISQNSEEGNKLALNMSVLGGILVPLNIVTGLWGMNTKVPGQDDDSLTWFFGILTFMFAISVFNTYMIIRWKRGRK